MSEFYLACRNGDFEFAKKYLLTLSNRRLNPNDIESHSKSTPLHAASFYGHKDIVKLLIDYGCDRSSKNSYGLTAYDEAANEEIRQLFCRPINDSSINRFQDDASDDNFDFVKRPKQTPAAKKIKKK